MAREGGDKVSIIGTADVEIKGPLGQDTSVNSVPVTLSTENSAVLSKIAESHVGGTTDPDNGVPRDITGNVYEKFKDSFDTVDVTNWDVVTGTGDAIIAEGNVASSNYNVISKGVAPAINTATSSSLTSKLSYNIPHDVMAGVTLAVRMQGQEFAMETVGVDTNGNIIAETPATPQAIQGTITIASNVATINLNAGHGLLAGDPVVLYGNAYSPLNVGPVQLTSVNLNPNQFTVPCTAANGTYTAGGYVVRKCPCGWAEEHSGIRWVGATAGNADAVSEAGYRPMVINWNPGNTQDVATYPNENGINYTSMPYTVALRPKGEWIIQRATEYSQYTVADQDSTTPYRSSAIPRRQNNASQQNKYKIRFRAESFENLTKPVGAVTAVSKSGSTTETVTCINHGLTVNDFITRYGARDQTNFANITTPTVVASVISADQFTVVGTGTFTGSSYGGFVARVNGNQNLTAQTISVQSYQKTTDGARLLLIGSGTWTPGYGTIHTLYGLVNSSNTRITALEGRYRVAAISTTSIELVPLDGQDLTSVSTSPVNAGGTLIANSDFRLHYAKLMSYARLMTEARRATGDRNRAQGVEVLNTPSVAVSTIGGSTPSQGIANGSTNSSQAVTISTAVSNTDQNATAFAGAGRVNGTVVASSRGGGAVITAEINLSSLTLGTASSIVFILQESNGGTNFTDIWTSDPVTTTGIIRVPAQVVGGRRRWCAHSVGGTSTTVTTTITALELPSGYPVVRQYRDAYAATNPLATVINNATVAATTLVNSGATCMTATTQFTPWCVVEGCKAITAYITLANGPTVNTQPVLTLQFSNDLTNAWNSAATMTAAGNGTYAASVSNTAFRYARIAVTTAAAYTSGNYTITSVGINGVN